jgi:rhodanese-related sulfurtransferase
MTGENRRILLEAAIILILGVVLGLSFNHRLVLNALQSRGERPAGELTSSLLARRLPIPVDLSALRQLVAKGAVLIDARGERGYRRGHLPGARSFPLRQVDHWMASFRRKFPLATPLVVYCRGHGCPVAFDLGVRLLKEGFRNVQVFEGGIAAWRDAGLPIVKGTP